MERPVTSHVIVQQQEVEEELPVVVVVDVVAEQEVPAWAVETVTTVESPVICLVTAQSREWAVAAVWEAEVIELATIVEKLGISRANAPARWEVVIVQIHANATTVMRPDISRVTVLMPTGVHQIKVELSASDAMRWDISPVTVPTVVVVLVVLVRAVVVAAVDRTCAATTAMRSDTSRATVQLWPNG